MFYIPKRLHVVQEVNKVNIQNAHFLQRSSQDFSHDFHQSMAPSNDVSVILLS